ncbi:MAG: hypothetical protein QXP70_02690 [Methanomassiliicoccales archaeon]
MTEVVVVVCGECGFGRIVERGKKTTSCPHCGSRFKIADARKYYEGSDTRVARELLFRINASGVLPSEHRKHKGKDVLSFLMEHHTFVLDDFAAYFGLENIEAKRRIEALMKEGAVYVHKGVYHSTFK